MYVDISVAQSIGGRENQEDFWAIWADGKLVKDRSRGFCYVKKRKRVLAALCDGMGGHNAGEVAAALAASTFIEAVRAPGSQNESTALVDASLLANERIGARIRADRSLNGMGTTLIGVKVNGGKLTWVSIGDSKLFLYRAGEINILNEDHSMVPVIEQMVARKILSREDAINHPDRNGLRSALCGDEVPLIDKGGAAVQLRKGDVVLIASDGVDVLSGSALRKLMRPGIFRRAKSIAQNIVEACVRVGGAAQDNTTVIILSAR